MEVNIGTPAKRSRAKVKSAATEDKKPAVEKKGKPAIAFDGLAERLHELPVPGGNYRGLRADGKRLWFLDQDLERKTQLKSIAVDNQGGPPEVLAKAEARARLMNHDGAPLIDG